MDPKGFDTVAFTTSEVSDVVPRLLALIGERWGNFLVETDRDDATNTTQFSQLDQHYPMSLIPIKHLVITCAKNDEMRNFFRDHSYELMANNEGAVSYHFRHRQKILFGFDRLNEVKRGEGEKYSVHPYPAWLAAESILELTAVTPASPTRDPFSEWAWRVLLEAALGSPIDPAELVLRDRNMSGTDSDDGSAMAGIPDR